VLHVHHRVAERSSERSRSILDRSDGFPVRAAREAAVPRVELRLGDEAKALRIEEEAFEERPPRQREL